MRKSLFKKKNNLNYFLYIIIVLLFFILYSSQKQIMTCSTLGSKIFDDILGFDWIQNACHLPIPKSCPENSSTILVTGQSNSANWILDNKYRNTHHLNYHNKQCYKLINPVLGADGPDDSVVPAIASKLDSLSPYIFLTTGIGGTSVKEWDSDYAKNTNKSLRELDKLGYPLKAVVWIQGVADSHTNIDYAKYFYSVKSQFLDGLEDTENIKFIITQSSRCHEKKEDKRLNQIKKNIAAENENIFITEGSDNLGNEYRFDTCHWNELGTEKVSDEISHMLNTVLEHDKDMNIIKKIYKYFYFL